MDESDEDERTIYCGNLSEEVTRDILFELFNQAGPVETVKRPKDVNGRLKNFGFVIYKHECSVPYALELFRYTKLFNKHLNLNSRSTLTHVPVLDTHLNDSNKQHTHVQQTQNDPGYPNERDYDSRSHHDRGGRRHEDHRSNHRERDSHRERDGYRERDGHRERDSHRDRHGHRERDSRKDRDSEPSSWSALKGQGLTAKGLSNRDDLNQQNSSRSRSSDPRPEFFGAQNFPDFNALLQLGQQMMPPGMLPLMPPEMLPQMPFQNAMGPGPNMFPSMQGSYDGGRVSPDKSRWMANNDDRNAMINSLGMPAPMGMGMGLGPGLGAAPGMFPSMQGGYNGGRVSPDRPRSWKDYQSDRHKMRERRDSPYERRPDHHHHDSRHSSSRSSYDRRRH